VSLLDGPVCVASRYGAASQRQQKFGNSEDRASLISAFLFDANETMKSISLFRSAMLEDDRLLWVDLRQRGSGDLRRLEALLGLDGQAARAVTGEATCSQSAVSATTSIVPFSLSR
jgi:hypothetical protein